jgi:hypothetical protein
MNTPAKIVHAIIHGFTEWESHANSTSQHNRSPYRGTVQPADCMLVQAYWEQSTKIGGIISWAVD